MTSGGGVDIDPAALAARADEVRESAERLTAVAAGLTPLGHGGDGVTRPRMLGDVSEVLTEAGMALVSALAATTADLAGRLDQTARSYARVEADAIAEAATIRRETSS